MFLSEQNKTDTSISPCWMDKTNIYMKLPGVKCLMGEREKPLMIC